MKLETLSVHAGYSPDPTTKAVAVPIYQTTSYAFDDTQHGADLFDLKVPGNIYTRIMNPTNDVLEQRVAALEGGIAAVAVASGMAAITYAIQTIAQVGDNIVSVAKLYGGTYNLMAHTFPRIGIEARFAPHDDLLALEALIDEKTKAVFCESITNPSGNIVDIQALATVAHRHGVPLIVDNTVATPYLCRPFEHGADIIIHSLNILVVMVTLLVGSSLIQVNFLGLNIKIVLKSSIHLMSLIMGLIMLSTLVRLLILRDAVLLHCVEQEPPFRHLTPS